MDNVLMTEWTIGALFVGVNAYRRYNTPSSNRASTTFQNYIIFFCFYLLASLALYMFLGALLDSSPETVGALYGLMVGQVGATLPEGITRMSAPMVSALFLTTMLPSLPWLSRYDKALLNAFWDRGHIPTHVYKMAASMRRAPFSFSPRQRKQLDKRCLDLGLQPESLSLKHSESLDFRWARINVLMESLAQWQQDDSGRIRRFMQEQRDELLRLQQLHEEINHEFADLKNEGLEEHIQNKISRFLDRSMAELFRSITVLIAKCVCVAAFSEDGRSVLVAQLGFEGGTRRSDTLSAHQVASALLAIFLVFLTLSVIQELGKEAQFRRFGSVAFMTLLMLFTYGAALLIALNLKRQVGMGYNELTHCRPWSAYGLVAILTALSWVLVTASYRYIANMLSGLESEANMARVFEALGWSFPYFLQSVALAVAVSYVLDFHQSRSTSGGPSLNQRLYYTGICVVALLVASVLAYYWMQGWGWFEGYASRDEGFRCESLAACWRPFSWFVIKGMAVAAIVGWLVPMWYYLNLTSAPEHIAGRLIRMNQRGLAREIRSLAPGQLVRAVAGVSAAVAAIDDNISRSEEDVFQIICSQFAGLAHSDLEVATAEQEFQRCLQQIEEGEFQLAECLQPLKSLSLLSSLMPYVASSIAFADHVFLEKEKEVVLQIQGLVLA